MLDTLCMRIGDIETLEVLTQIFLWYTQLEAQPHLFTLIGIMICFILDSKCPPGPCMTLVYPLISHLHK